MLIRNCVSEITDLLTKTLAMTWSRQGNQIVCDHDKSPVCLNALPGTHKHMAEGQVLFDVLVKDFDSESLAVKSDHLGFAHFEIVGDQESGFLGASFGDKEKHRSDLGQMDDTLGNFEPSFFGNTDGFVSPRSLGQVTDDGFGTVDFQNAVALDRGHKGPFGFDNRNKNGSTGIPAVHQYRHGGMNFSPKILKNFLSQPDFAFEFAFGTRSFGAISFHSPGEPLASYLQNASHNALPLDQPLGRVMNAQALDVLAPSGTGGIVDSDKQLWRFVDSLSQEILVGLLKTPAFLGRTVEKTLQVVWKRLGHPICNFPGGMELDEPDQPHKVNPEVFALRFCQDIQEMFQNGRCFLRENFSHGFRALLGLVSIGDFGRKPFYLKYLSLFVT